VMPRASYLGHNWIQLMLCAVYGLKCFILIWRSSIVCSDTVVVVVVG